MAATNRFARPTRIFLDGDQEASVGCILLPGQEAPERVVFQTLQHQRWRNVWSRIGRDIASVSDACERAMTQPNHHDWVVAAANELLCGGDILWQAMCAEWAEITPKRDIQCIIDEVGDALT